MADTYVECLVKRKSSPVLKALQGLLAVLAVIFFVGMSFMGWVGLIVAVVAGVGAYLLSLNANLEYEYLYVDREITIDKILNMTKRKQVEKFEADRIEMFAPVNSWHLDQYKNMQFKVTDYSSRMENPANKAYAMIYSGNRKIILEPNEALVKALASIAPRKVFMD